MCVCEGQRVCECVGGTESVCVRESVCEGQRVCV